MKCWTNYQYKKIQSNNYWIIYFGIIFFLVFNFLFSTKRLFEHNIISPIPHSVSNIKSHIDRSAMHGAILFIFSANNNDAEEIIKINSLSKYEKIPDEVRYIINLGNDVKWWKSSVELEKMKIYGKMTKNEYDWGALFIFIDAKNTNYIIKI
ncbi:MAG: hypothetical protein KAI71_04705 [Candidatus Pacebacteria bacterium]|nr:hypothetical protein [Candidatus Paceibacterota bacterium]